MHELLTIGEVAERSGMAASAIRFYDRQGLIHAERTPGGQRRFRRDVLGGSPLSGSRNGSG